MKTSVLIDGCRGPVLCPPLVVVKTSVLINACRCTFLYPSFVVVKTSLLINACLGPVLCPPLVVVKTSVLINACRGPFLCLPLTVVMTSVLVNACGGPFLCPLLVVVKTSVLINACRGPVLCPLLAVVKLSVLINGHGGPGCSSREPLNSRTFNIALETSASTCAPHRAVRQIERDFICSRASKQRLQRNLDYQQWKSSRGQSSGGKVGQGHPAGAKVRSSSSVYDFSSSASSDREVRRLCHVA